jgi:hypothetical protein
MPTVASLLCRGPRAAWVADGKKLYESDARLEGEAVEVITHLVGQARDTALPGASASRYKRWGRCHPWRSVPCSSGEDRAESIHRGAELAAGAKEMREHDRSRHVPSNESCHCAQR